MPTPIRVRGKRHRERREDNGSVGSSRSVCLKRHARQSKHAEACTSQFRPQLELLPVELLEQIFLYGTNLELPLVCRRFYYALTSSLLRVRMLLQIWQAESNLTDNLMSLVDNDNSIPVDISWSHRVFEKEVTERLARYSVSDKKELAAVHSAILRQPWVTYDLVRHCQWIHLRNFVRRECSTFLKDTPAVEKQEKLAVLEARLRSNLSWGSSSPYFIRQMWRYQPALTAVYTPGECVPAYETGRSDGSVFRCFFPAMRGLNTVCIVSVSERLHVDDEKCDGTLSPFTRQLKISAFPCLAETTEVPSRLVRGPWTQSKGNFLDLVIRAVFKPIKVQKKRPGNNSIRLQHFADASDGLLEAIREHNLLAVTYLTRVPSEDELIGNMFVAEAKSGRLILDPDRLKGIDIELAPRPPDALSEILTLDKMYYSHEAWPSKVQRENSHPVHDKAKDQSQAGTKHGILDSEHMHLLPALHLSWNGPWRALHKEQALSDEGRSSAAQRIYVCPERRHVEAQLRHGRLDQLGAHLLKTMIIQWLLNDDLLPYQLHGWPPLQHTSGSFSVVTSRILGLKRLYPLSDVRQPLDSLVLQVSLELSLENTADALERKRWIQGALSQLEAKWE